MLPSTTITNLNTAHTHAIACDDLIAFIESKNSNTEYWNKFNKEMNEKYGTVKPESSLGKKIVSNGYIDTDQLQDDTNLFKDAIVNELKKNKEVDLITFRNIVESVHPEFDLNRKNLKKENLPNLIGLCGYTQQLVTDLTKKDLIERIEKEYFLNKKESGIPLQN